MQVISESKWKVQVEANGQRYDVINSNFYSPNSSGLSADKDTMWSIYWLTNRQNHLHYVDWHNTKTVALEVIERSEEMKYVTVQLGDIGEYQCIAHKDTQWRDFASPFFTREVAEQALTDLCRRHSEFYVTSLQSTWEYVENYGLNSYFKFIHSNLIGNTEYFEATNRIQPDGSVKYMYAIGMWSWGWRLSGSA